MFRTNLPELSRHIYQTERSIVQQRACIQRLTALGHSTESAWRLLGEMQRRLDTLIERRRKLLQRSDKRP